MRKELCMLNALIMIVSAMIIILSLLQSGKSDGISGAFSGRGGLNLFANTKERGSEKIISNINTGAAIVIDSVYHIFNIVMVPHFAAVFMV